MRLYCNMNIRECFAALLLLLLAACTHAEPSVFDGEYDSARFPHKREDTEEAEGYDVEKQVFVSSFSFIDVNMPKEYTISIPLVLSGRAIAKERVVEVEPIISDTNAPNGSYRIVSAVIFADALVGEVKILLYNLPELREQAYTLALKIKDSKDLKAGPDEDIKAILTWNASIPIPTASALVSAYNMLIDSPIEYNSTDEAYISSRALEVIAECFNWYDLDNAQKWGSQHNGASVGNYKYLMSSYWIAAGGAQRIYAKRLSAFIDDYNSKNPDAPLIHNSGAAKGMAIKARKY